MRGVFFQLECCGSLPCRVNVPLLRRLIRFEETGDLGLRFRLQVVHIVRLLARPTARRLRPGDLS